MIKKLINLNMKLFFLLINILIYSVCYPQIDIQGKYCKSYNTGYSSVCIEFHENSKFSYSTHGCLGIEDKGKGNYLLKEGKIILNFDKVEKEQRSKIYIQKIIDNKIKDSIRLNLKIFDGYNVDIPLPATILSEADSFKYEKGFKVNEQGEVTIFKPKNSKVEKYRILFIGYEQFEFKLSNSKSKNIEIILNTAGPNFISDQTMEIAVKHYNQESIELKNGTRFNKK